MLKHIATLDDQVNVIYPNLLQIGDIPQFSDISGNEKKIYAVGKNNSWCATWIFRDGFPFWLQFYPKVTYNENLTSESFCEMANNILIKPPCDINNVFLLIGIGEFAFKKIVRDLLIDYSIKAKEHKEKKELVKKYSFVPSENFLSKIFNKLKNKIFKK